MNASTKTIPTMKSRHRIVRGSFVVLVVVPVLTAAVYLFFVASDQYASTVAFTVRAEDQGAGVQLFGGIAELSGMTSTDTDILYVYIQSQELVRTLDAQLNLQELYARPKFDPVFAFAADRSIEGLVSYWGRMTRIAYDSATGLIEIRALAFRPDDAQTIAAAVLHESSRLVNELSAIARDDATRFAKLELELAVQRLKASREQVTAFRARTQIVDPSADIEGQMGLLNTLQARLAEAYIQVDLLRQSTFEADIRISQAELRIDVIEARIEAERRKLGVGSAAGVANGTAYADVIAEFERLNVDREFAEQAYLAALASYDMAVAEARRQSRYLAPYIKPTLAEAAQYPQRITLIGLLGLFLSSAWAVGVLIYYSIRDRR